MKKLEDTLVMLLAQNEEVRGDAGERTAAGADDAGAASVAPADGAPSVRAYHLSACRHRRNEAAPTETPGLTIIMIQIKVYSIFVIG